MINNVQLLFRPNKIVTHEVINFQLLMEECFSPYFNKCSVNSHHRTTNKD